MKKLIQLYTLVLFFGTASAQVCKDIPNNTTNPDNPQDYRGSNPTTNYYINKDINNPNEPKLDWREVPYSYHINGTTLCPDVYNPFFADDNNENISHLYDQNPLLRDNHPADGWELLSFDLGRLYNGNIATNLDQYINTYKHLPDVPSEQEVYDNGIAVTEMLQIQMKKIEELTLYILQQQKEIDELKATLETK